MNFLCLVGGVVEYASTSLADFNHYQLTYYDEHQDVENVEYLVLSDEDYDALLSANQ